VFRIAVVNSFSIVNSFVVVSSPKDKEVSWPVQTRKWRMSGLGKWVLNVTSQEKPST
jgi:hypothetical protein